MAEVIPMSDIILLYDVPLNSNYENTFLFDTANQQLTYFLNTFEYRRFDYQSYQRKHRGWLRIAAPYVNVYNANYLIFKNDIAIDGDHPVLDYEQKYYYAFITQIRYINERTAEIHYVLDVLQSYMFDWTLTQCMVERETVIRDAPGLHRIDEGLPIGDYEYSDTQRMKFRPFNASGYVPLHLSFGTKVVIAATVNDNYEDTTEGATITQQWENTIVGCNLLVKELGNIQSSDYALYWLNHLPGEKQSAILGIYLIGQVITEAQRTYNASTLLAQVPFSDGYVDGYTPWNKKLLTAPYKALVVFSSDGTSKVFDYYKFRDTTTNIIFYLDFAFTAPIQGALYPANYQGEGAIEQISAIPLPTVPSCTWSNDTYKAWAALNTGYMISSIAGSVVDAGIKVGGAIATAGISGAVSEVAGASVLSGAGEAIGETYGFVGETAGQALGRNVSSVASGIGKQAGGLLGDIQNIANNFIALHNARIQPDSFNGSAQNLTAINNGYYGFAYGTRCIRQDYARMLDRYFTMFGYKVNELKVPSLKNRTNFTYVKTMNSDISGLIPSDDRAMINAIFNAGIRFWSRPDLIGVYEGSIPNDPLNGYV